MTLITSEEKPNSLYHFLTAAIAPRPICFASTVDAQGRPNLSPFSFFNVFGSNPPTLIFSPVLRGRDGSTKHTLENIFETMEVVINVVSYKMVQQTSLSSCEYPKGIDEFEKAGFTKIASQKLKPFRVAESPVQMECVVKQIIKTGAEGGAGNLVICEILVMHIDDNILDEHKIIDPNKIDLVGRMGTDFYCRASGSAIFEVAKPNQKIGMGFDQLPNAIRSSKALSGNDLGMLANMDSLPEIDPSFEDEDLRKIFQYYAHTPDEMENELHLLAKKYLQKNDVQKAWQVLLANNF